MYQTTNSFEIGWLMPLILVISRLFPPCPFPLMTIGTILIKLSKSSLFGGVRTMLCIQKCDMHLFQTEEQKQPIVYQVETGLFFKLDTLFQSILACCEGLSACPGCPDVDRSI